MMNGTTLHDYRSYILIATLVCLIFVLVKSSKGPRSDVENFTPSEKQKQSSFLVTDLQGDISLYSLERLEAVINQLAETRIKNLFNTLADDRINHHITNGAIKTELSKYQIAGDFQPSGNYQPAGNYIKFGDQIQLFNMWNLKEGPKSQNAYLGACGNHPPTFTQKFNDGCNKLRVDEPGYSL